MMLLPIKTAEIAAGLICHKPVVVLGPMGSGKYNVAVQAMGIVSTSWFEADMKYAQRPRFSDLTWEDAIAPRARFMNYLQNLLKKYPERDIICSNIEYASSEFVMLMFEQMMFSKRKVIVVGDFRTRDEMNHFMPMFERCQIVEM